MAQLKSETILSLLKTNARLHRVRGAVRDHRASSLLESGKSHESEEKLEEWVDSHKASPCFLSTDHLDHLTAHVTDKSYEKTLMKFTEHCGSRYVGDEGNKKAAAFITNHLSNNGFKVKEEAFDFTLPYNLAEKQLSSTAKALPSLIQLLSAQAGNIVGYLEGTDLKHETVLYGAHYDSVNWRNKGSAPGVDDNASGIASLLLLAEALKNHAPRRSVVLVAFNAEELGLLGSKAFVEKNVESKNYGDIKAALIADEIAFAGRPEFDHRAIFETSGKSDGTLALLDTMAHHASDLAHFEVNYNGFGSDHMPFLQAGVPAVLLIERDDEWKADKDGHSEADTISSLNMDFGAKMTRTAIKAFAHLANPGTA